MQWNFLDRASSLWLFSTLLFYKETPQHIYIFNDILCFVSGKSSCQDGFASHLFLQFLSSPHFFLLPMYVALPLPFFALLYLSSAPFSLGLLSLPPLTLHLQLAFSSGASFWHFYTSNSLRPVSILSIRCHTPNFCLSLPKALKFKTNSWKKKLKSHAPYFANTSTHV